MDPLPPVKPPWILGPWAPRWLLWFVVGVGTLLIVLAIADVAVNGDGRQLFRAIVPLIALGVAAATLRHRAKASRDGDRSAGP
jgi:hypothetical protein